MPTTNNPQEPKFGYRFSHSESSDVPCDFCLDIFINENPTEHHFDPEKLHLHVRSKSSALESLTIRHPWVHGSAYQALAGSIELTDRYGKEEEAFTFGGNLIIKSSDTFTFCTLESPAPILEISSADPISMMFIEEIEILFAKRRAALLSKPHTFEKHLINANPSNLYLACLNALIEKFEHLHHKEELHINEFLNFLHVESKRIRDEGKTPVLVPDLEKIL